MNCRVLFLCAFATLAVVIAPSPPVLYPDRELDSGLGHVFDVTFSSDGRLLAAVGARGYGVWDAQTGNVIRKESAGAGKTGRVALSNQGTVLAVGADDGRVTVVDLRSGGQHEVVRHSRPITAIAFAPDGRMGASGDTEGNLLVWDADHVAASPLKDGGQKKDILLLAFTGNTLLSVSKDLRVVTWDVQGKRPTRRATLQSEVRGRTVVANAAAVDAAAEKLVVAAQLVSEPRGGVLGGREMLARPEDLRRDNVLIPYTISTGISSDSVKTNEFQPDRIAMGPGACFAFFTSVYRDQPRLHVWGLVEQGDDLVRVELPGRAPATAAAVEPGGHYAVVGSDAGLIRTWRVSGATSADCEAYAKKPTTTAGPTITLGSETQPLIKAAPGNRIAVLRFEATGVDAGLGDAVAEMVAGELSNNPQVTVVERTAINAILKEMEVQRSGLTAADAVKIGRGLNARTVVFGSVRRFGESTYLITARAVSVETQQVEGSREVTCEACKEQDLPRAVAVLRRAIVP